MLNKAPVIAGAIVGVMLMAIGIKITETQLTPIAKTDATLRAQTANGVGTKESVRVEIKSTGGFALSPDFNSGFLTKGLSTEDLDSLAFNALYETVIKKCPTAQQVYDGGRAYHFYADINAARVVVNEFKLHNLSTRNVRVMCAYDCQLSYCERNLDEARCELDGAKLTYNESSLYGKNNPRLNGVTLPVVGK